MLPRTCLHTDMCHSGSRWPDTWADYQLAKAAGAQLTQDTLVQLCHRAIEVGWPPMAVLAVLASLGRAMHAPAHALSKRMPRLLPPVLVTAVTCACSSVHNQSQNLDVLVALKCESASSTFVCKSKSTQPSALQLLLSCKPH